MNNERKPVRKKRRALSLSWIPIVFAVLIVSAFLFTMRPAQTPQDTTPPTLSGVHDFVIYEGDSISYMDGITAVDDQDPSPTITADTGSIDLNHPGAYEITYTATDTLGNKATQTAAVTVLEMKEGYVDLNTIYAAVDEKLEQILWEGATPKEQVQAIYAWARSNLNYGGFSDRSDWRQTGYTMLTEGIGNCYGYFSVTKLMFERLGIPNIDVSKVKNHAEDSDHFWSMVSVDGGETYYHFDATPRVSEGDDFCLVTDAFLDAYSANNKNCFNRNRSLYPATPTDSP